MIEPAQVFILSPPPPINHLLLRSGATHTHTHTPKFGAGARALSEAANLAESSPIAPIAASAEAKISRARRDRVLCCATCLADGVVVVVVAERSLTCRWNEVTRSFKNAREAAGGLATRQTRSLACKRASVRRETKRPETSTRTRTRTFLVFKRPI